MTIVPAIELQQVSKRFGSVIALNHIDIKVNPGEVHCLLGDNGAGKSTLIKILSGVYQPTEGKILVAGKEVHFRSPRDASEYGVATVFQDLGLIPLMSISRNFFLGREPVKGIFPFRRFDKERANTIARQAMADVGIQVRDPTQAVGTLSGGERQSVAIARAIYFGAKVLILDEPTSALGVHQAAMVLKFVIEAGCAGWRSYSSRTTSGMLIRLATRSRCSIAAAARVLSGNPKLPAMKCFRSCRVAKT